MSTSDSTTVLGWLRAAGEESRLRLLALCAQHELSVSDLAEALRQSEPRVSRHLKILSDAGLLERTRQGQWVHYRVTRFGAAGEFLQGLLSQIDRNDSLFARERTATGASSAGTARVNESRLGRALKGFVEAVDLDFDERAAGGSGVGEESLSALVVGVEHLELIEAAAAAAGRCVAIAHSRRAAQTARAFVERRGIACRVLLAASSGGLCEKDIEAAGAPFDVVFLDRLVLQDSGLDGLLKYGRRALASTGRLWVFESYEALESPQDKVVEHPIGRLRRLLDEAGMNCERLSPLEADGRHVIAAVAVPSRGVSRGSLTVGAA
jgi:DNA-binding transcriptional ArsR family regulator